jgi:hypothetical protein
MPLAVDQECRLGVPDDARLSWHVSRVIGQEAQVVWVAAPAALQARLADLRGTKVVIETWRNADAQYAAHADIVAVDWTPPYQLALMMEGATRIQRRDYVRVTMSMWAEETLALKPDGDYRPFRLLIEDLSAIGLRGMVAHTIIPGAEVELAADDRFELDLPLDDGVPSLHVRARVVRAIEIEDLPSFDYEIGAEFVDIEPADHERLVRFVLQLQYDRARKGLLR